MEELELFHSWKWVWEGEKESSNNYIGGNDDENQHEGLLLDDALFNATVPVREDENANFDPVADEHEHDPLQSEVRSIMHRRESLDEVVPTRRHYSVDFYSSLLLPGENEQASEKPRSSSFSLHRPSTSRRSSSRKVHHSRGGYIVISAIRKKVKISGGLLSPREKCRKKINQ